VYQVHSATYKQISSNMKILSALIIMAYLIQYLRYFNKLLRAGGPLRLKYESTHSVLILAEAVLSPLIWPAYNKIYPSTKCLGEDCPGCQNDLLR
jgi:hypothetical protein